MSPKPTTLDPIAAQTDTQETTELGERDTDAVPPARGISASVQVDFQAPVAKPALTGADTIAHFGEIGETYDRFCLLTAHDDPKSTSPGKQPIEKDWQHKKREGARALAHFAEGKNVGLRTGGESHIAVPDFDSEFIEFLTTHPQYAGAAMLKRINAPDRAKLFFYVEGPTPSKSFKKSNGYKHDLDILGDGKQTAIAGTHPSGAQIEFCEGDFIRMRSDDFYRLVDEWVGQPAPRKQPKKAMSPTTAAALAVRTSEEVAHDAAMWWMAQPANEAAATRLLAKCKQQREYVSIRPDDDTPSTKEADDAYARTVKRIWRDYGVAENLDILEIYCRLTGLNKTDYMRDVVIPDFKKALAAARRD
jgi:hypothetical protein